MSQRLKVKLDWIRRVIRIGKVLWSWNSTYLAAWTQKNEKGCSKLLKVISMIDFKVYKFEHENFIDNVLWI